MLAFSWEEESSEAADVELQVKGFGTASSSVNESRHPAWKRQAVAGGYCSYESLRVAEERGILVCNESGNSAGRPTMPRRESSGYPSVSVPPPSCLCEGPRFRATCTKLDTCLSKVSGLFRLGASHSASPEMYLWTTHAAS